MKNIKELFRTYKDTIYSISNFGQVINNRTNKLLKIGINRNGYPSIFLYTNNGRKMLRVHSMVAHSFIGPIKDGQMVNHINGIKTDNRVENLEYCTHGENMKHAYNIGLKKGMKGEMNPNSRFTSDEILFIRSLRFMYNVSVPNLRKLLPDISRTSIQDIVGYKIWKHV
jgi:hypothetical protein